MNFSGRVVGEKGEDEPGAGVVLFTKAESTRRTGYMERHFANVWLGCLWPSGHLSSRLLAVWV